MPHAPTLTGSHSHTHSLTLIHPLTYTHSTLRLSVLPSGAQLWLVRGEELRCTAGGGVPSVLRQGEALAVPLGVFVECEDVASA